MGNFRGKLTLKKYVLEGNYLQFFESVIEFRIFDPLDDILKELENQRFIQ